VKLVRDEPESSALRALLADADLVSCELLLAEVPRASAPDVLRDHARAGRGLGQLVLEHTANPNPGRK
jgi:hypothetical protein